MKSKDILLILRGGDKFTFSNYLPEILSAEGIFNFECSASCEGVDEYAVVATYAELNRE